MNRHVPGGLAELSELVDSNRIISPVQPKLDPSEYAEDMAEFVMTEDQKREFLETLWSIMRSFAEMGHTIDVCGQLFDDFNEVAELESDGVGSGYSINTEKLAGKESSP